MKREGSFKFHVSEVCRKAGRKVKALRRQFGLLNIQSKMKVFNAFIRANLNYCALVWVTRNRTDLYNDSDCSNYDLL